MSAAADPKPPKTPPPPAGPPGDRFHRLNANNALHRIWMPFPGSTRRLVVFLHGFASLPKDYVALLSRIQCAANADVYAPAYDATIYSDLRPEVVTEWLASHLNQIAFGYERVDLAGHSVGTLFVREAFVKGLGESNDATPLRRLLSENRLRLTLMAGTNRGFTPKGWQQNFGLLILRRWFWLTLLAVALAWCLRVFAQQERHWIINGVFAVVGAYLVLPAAGLLTSVARRRWRTPTRFWQVVFQRQTRRLAAAVVLLSLWTAIWFSAIAQALIAATIGTLAALALAALAAKLWMNEVFPRQGAFLLLADALWLLWGGWGAGWLFWSALVAMTLLTLWTGLLLAKQRQAPWVMGVAAMGVGLAALFVVEHPRFAWPATLLLLLPAALYPMQSRLFIEHVLYGAPWITGLRLRWIKKFAGARLVPPPVVHLFGEEDRLVSEDDHLELHYGPSAFEVALEGVRHTDFLLAPFRPESFPVDLRDQPRFAAASTTVGDAIDGVFGDDPDGWAASLRRTASAARATKSVGRASAKAGPYRLIEASTSPAVAEASRQGKAASTHWFRQRFSPPPEEHVVFLIHGIRDFADWQDSLATKFREVAKGTLTPDGRAIELVDVVQVRYGYFSALQFLLVGERERATRAFLDLYAQTRARRPLAKCHAAAHSNGTYVVGNALLAHEYVELENAYLAGSVLAKDFPWTRVGPDRLSNDGEESGGTVKRVRSDRAARDWPVGVLCYLLSVVGKLWLVGKPYRLLGTGGVFGFNEAREAASAFVFENAYLPGGHSDALRPKFHAEIAEYVLTGKPERSDRDVNGFVDDADRRYLRGVMTQSMIGLACVVALFAGSIVWGFPDPAWGVAVGALLTLFVLRVGMAV